MIILVDCDDTIIDLSSKWIERLNKIYGTDYKASDITDGNFTGMFNASKDELLAPLTDEELWSGCEPITDAVKYLRKLHTEGNSIYIVTATDYRNFSGKVELLIKRYFPFIPQDNIILCHNKRLLKADFLIDDNIDNFCRGSYQGILFTRSHNKNIDDVVLELSDIKRAFSWKECYSIIKEHI